MPEGLSQYDDGDVARGLITLLTTRAATRSVAGAPRIQVFVRLKPSFGESSLAISSDGMQISLSVDCSPARKRELSLRLSSPVLSEEASQRDVWEMACRKTATQFLRGADGVIVAAGGRGSGKTFTALALDPQGDNGSGGRDGIVIRACAAALRYLELPRAGMVAEAPTTGRLMLRVQQVYLGKVETLAQTVVGTLADARLVLKSASAARAKTPRHKIHSRSHCVATLTLEQPNFQTSRPKMTSKLFIVDLVGGVRSAECARDAASIEERRQRREINLCLSATRRVLVAVSKNETHVPFRDSELTWPEWVRFDISGCLSSLRRMLRRVLGGAREGEQPSRDTSQEVERLPPQATAVLLLCCSPEARELNETSNTLRWGADIVSGAQPHGRKQDEPVFFADSELEPSTVPHRYLDLVEEEGVLCDGSTKSDSGALIVRLEALELEVTQLRAQNSELRAKLCLKSEGISTATMHKLKSEPNSYEASTLLGQKIQKLQVDQYLCPNVNLRDLVCKYEALFTTEDQNWICREESPVSSLFRRHADDPEHMRSFLDSLQATLRRYGISRNRLREGWWRRQIAQPVFQRMDCDAMLIWASAEPWIDDAEERAYCLGSRMFGKLPGENELTILHPRPSGADADTSKELPPPTRRRFSFATALASFDRSTLRRSTSAGEARPPVTSLSGGHRSHEPNQAAPLEGEHRAEVADQDVPVLAQPPKRRCRA